MIQKYSKNMRTKILQKKLNLAYDSFIKLFHFLFFFCSSLRLKRYSNKFYSSRYSPTG